MSNESAAAYFCPVCDAPLDEAAPRCFRCETGLARWWPLQDALASEATRSPYLPHVVLLVVGLLCGASLGALRKDANAPSSPTIAPRPGAPIVRTLETPSPPRRITYRVQRGDSLWRIAAALTGDGRKWKDLWPEYEGRELTLLPGSILTLPNEWESVLHHRVSTLRDSGDITTSPAHTP